MIILRLYKYSVKNEFYCKGHKWQMLAMLILIIEPLSASTLWFQTKESQNPLLFILLAQRILHLFVFRVILDLILLLDFFKLLWIQIFRNHLYIFKILLTINYEYRNFIILSIVGFKKMSKLVKNLQRFNSFVTWMKNEQDDKSVSITVSGNGLRIFFPCPLWIEKNSIEVNPRLLEAPSPPDPKPPSGKALDGLNAHFY